MKSKFSLIVAAFALAVALTAAPAQAACPAGTTDPSYCTPGPPTASTNSPTSITTTGATLNGTVNPNGATTTYHFEYGTTTTYGSVTPTQTITAPGTAIADYQDKAVTAAIGNLTPNTTYHFRVVADNANSPDPGVNGADTTFKTADNTITPPTVTTEPATAVTNAGATLNGTVNPNNSVTTYQFEYGTTTSYGTKTTSGDVGEDSTVHNVSTPIVGLTPNTLYHFRTIAKNAGGEVTGQDRTFTTAANSPNTLPPTATTTAATNVASASATLNGLVNPNGTATSYAFQYGTTTEYGTNTPATPVGAADSSNHAVSTAIGGLQPGTTYHFRVAAANAAGLVFGQDLTFTTPGSTTGGKKKPKLTLSVKPKRDTKKPYGYKTSGTLRLPSGVTKAQGCHGNITVKIRRGRRVVGAATTKLKSSCKYKKTVVVTKTPQRIHGQGRRQGKLHVRAYFPGNDVLTKATSPKRNVAYGSGKLHSAEFG